MTGARHVLVETAAADPLAELAEFGEFAASSIDCGLWCIGHVDMLVVRTVLDQYVEEVEINIDVLPERLDDLTELLKLVHVGISVGVI